MTWVVALLLGVIVTMAKTTGIDTERNIAKSKKANDKKRKYKHFVKPHVCEKRGEAGLQKCK